MEQPNALIDRYFAAWNETDTARRHDLIAQTWTENATYVDPLMAGAGHAGIDAMIGGVQTQFPGHQFALLGAVDAHHDRVRFAWQLAPAGGEALVKGTDFAVVVADRRNGYRLPRSGAADVDSVGRRRVAVGGG